METKDTIVNQVFNRMGFRHNTTLESLAKHTKLTKEQVYGALTKLIAEGTVTKYDGEILHYRRMEKTRPTRKRRQRRGESQVVNGKVQSSVDGVEEARKKIEASPETTEETLSELTLVESLDKLLSAAGEIEQWYKDGHVVESDKKKIAELEEKVRRQNEKLGQYEAKITQLQKENKHLDNAGAAIARELERIKAGLAILSGEV